MFEQDIKVSKSAVLKRMGFKKKDILRCPNSGEEDTCEEWIERAIYAKSYFEDLEDIVWQLRMLTKI